VLQDELDSLSSFSRQNGLVINKNKCFVMKFSRAKSHNFPPEFTVGGFDILEEKQILKILGIQIQADLCWDTQVTKMVQRATRTIWALRRMKSLGVDQATLVQFWRTEGRVHLEAACPVWNGAITAAQSRALSRVQRVAMAATTGRWDRSHSGQLRRLSLEPLTERRTRLCRRWARRTATGAKSRHRAPLP
jgi:hypothetical protein